MILVRAFCLGICLWALFGCTSHSANQRANWVVLSRSPGSGGVPFISLKFFDEQNGLGLTAVGLLRTRDGGIHWDSQLSTKGGQGFFSMRFLDPRKGWIVGQERHASTDLSPPGAAKPIVLQTEDGGITWGEIDVDGFTRAQGAKFSRFSSICSEMTDKLWIAGDAGIVEAIIEASILKVLDVSLTSAALKDVACEGGEVWAVGDAGLIMHYQQKKWGSTPYSDINAFFNKVRISTHGLWVVGGLRVAGQDSTRGILLNSRNGSDWVDKTPSNAGLLIDFTINDDEGLLVGVQGSIYRTNDSGATWRDETSPTKDDLYSIFTLTTHQRWIGGDKSTVLVLRQN